MDIRPFRGWRYVGGPAGDVSSLISPPYDVLSGEDKEALLARDANNIVAVDLPHVPPDAVGPESEYRSAATLLETWKTSGVLRRDDRDALYAYEQTYRWAGRTFTRRAILCGVRATPLGRDVIPHEQTFAGPKADRLKLTEQTRMQLSPIFGFYDDPGGRAGELLFAAAATAGEPPCRGTLGGVQEKLWCVTDAGTIDRIAEALKDVPVFIADGHHRYTTALSYRDALRRTGRIGDDDEANFVLFALVATNDPGLLILPTHRVVSGLKDGFTVDALIGRARQFSWSSTEAGGADLGDADAYLRRFGPGAMGFVGPGAGEIHIAKLQDPQAMREVAPDQSETWRSLDVARLHRMILERDLAPWRTSETAVEYTPDGPAVLQACASGRAQLGILLQGTPLTAVEAVARTGGSMPHKSTYFYPKLATGMVLKPLE